MFNKLFTFLLLLVAGFSNAVPFFGVSKAYGAVGTFIPYDQAVKTGIISQRVDIDYGPKIYKDRVNVSPMLYIMDNMRSRPAKTTTIKGFEQRSYKRTVTATSAIVPAGSVNTANTLATVSLSADDVKSVQVNSTFEIMFSGSITGNYTKYVYVYDKPTTTTIRLLPIDSTKAVRSAAGTDFPSGSKLWRTGSMFGQNDRSVDGVSTHVNVIENYTQIFRNPYELSESAKLENLYANETERNRLMEEARYEHLLGIESALLFNGPKVLNTQTSSSSVQRGYLEGIYYTITQNSGNHTTYSDPVDIMDAFDDWQYGLFSPRIIDGNQFKRFLLCNKAMRKHFHNIKEQKPGIEIGPNGTYGIPGIDTIRMDNGYEFDAYLHPMIDERYPDEDKPFGMALHLAYMEFRPYRRTKLNANIQYNDQDGIKDEFKGEYTYLMYIPELAGVIEYVV